MATTKRTKLGYPLNDGRNSFGQRRRFKGKMVQVVNGKAVARSRTHGGSSPARAGYECGQDQPYDSKTIPGQYRVTLPHGRVKYVKPDGCS